MMYILFGRRGWSMGAGVVENTMRVIVETNSAARASVENYHFIVCHC